MAIRDLVVPDARGRGLGGVDGDGERNLHAAALADGRGHADVGGERAGAAVGDDGRHVGDVEEPVLAVQQELPDRKSVV